MKSLYLFILTLLYLSALSNAQNYFFDSDNQPWYTSMYPRSIHLNNKTYVAFQHTSMDPYITVFNHGTGQWSEIVKAGTSDINDNDTHGNPVVWADDSAYLYVTYGGHGHLSNNPQKVSRSDAPENIDSWSDIPSFDSKCTYPQVHTKSNGDIIVFYRNGVHSINQQTSDPWVYQISSDGGKTWFEKNQVLAKGDGDLYVMTAMGTNDILHVTIVWESPPEIGRQDVYYIYQKEEKWYNQYNKALPVPIGLSELNADSCKIYDTGGDKTTHIPDMSLDKSNNLYLGIVSTEQENFIFAKRTGDQPFTTSIIADGAVYWHNSAVLDVISPAEIIAYVNAHGTTGKGGTVEKWLSIDSGKAWAKAEDVTDFNDAYSMQRVHNGHVDARLLFEKASDHTLYLYGNSGMVGEMGLEVVKTKMGAQTADVLLDLNNPTPLNQVSNINFTVPSIAHMESVQLMVYNTLGWEVAALVDDKLKPGSYEVKFDTGELASGIYFFKFIAGSIISSQTMVVIR